MMDSAGLTDMSAMAAFASAVISIAAMILSIRAAKSAKSHQQAASEEGIHVQISTARAALEASVIALSQHLGKDNLKDLAPDRLQHANVLISAMKSRAEDYLNAFERGCTLYNDKKCSVIDRDRFKKSYKRPVDNICNQENDQFNELMHPRSSSHFPEIWRAFDSFNATHP